MASSPSSDQDRQRRPARLARHNSSFLGTIKTIVTAPLTWFANQDDDATPGKRRRSSPPPPTAVSAPDDELSRHSKRMRMQSPPRPYLDPPPSALRRSSVVPRASSAVLPSTRATFSPRRNPIARTMSIDPPRRDPSFNFGTDSDVDMLVDKDLSLPPSPRPSFRLRTSLTPQPQQQPTRYISEPPPLNALISNPTFLHAPAQTHEPSPAPTLGSLVESVRGARSPTRQQHSSLLFSSNASNVTNENKDAPAERALHQLEVYKTPLLPTRMRSSNLPASITASTTPDMFKSRRSSHLVLMKDDRDRLGRRVSGSGRSPVVNETKPYAGEGGMKKLLARRKQEEEEEEDTVSQDATPHPRQPTPPPSDFIPDPPVPSKSDWFSSASGSSTSGSSLRVGRAKTSRNHFQRPSKTRFSAVYDEEVDDVIDDNENRQKERQMLEEAAKKVPVFAIPAGFSFAKDVPPVKPAEIESAKEPPITSLPFTFSKPATATQAPAPAPVVVPSTTTQGATLEVPPPPARVPTPESKAAAPGFPTFTLAPATAPPSGGGIPNFFANSQVLAAARDTPPSVPPPVLDFGTSNSSSSTPFSFSPAPSSTPSQPVNDTENPFWDGEKKNSTDGSKPVQSLFGCSSKGGDSEPVASPVSIFGATASAFPLLPKLDTASSTTSAPPQPEFSFAKPAQETAPLSDFGGASSSGTLKLPFSFGAPPEVKKPEQEPSAPKPLFAANGSSASAFGEAAKSGPTLFGEPPKAASPFGSPAPPQPTPSPLPFSFGAPQSSATAPSSTLPSFFGAAPSGASTTVEAPKPLFGSSSGFSFGQSSATEKEKEAKPTPFSFGGAPSTPPVESQPAPFSFGSTPSTSAVSPAAESKQALFSFGSAPSTSGASPAPESKPATFSFGQPSTAAPVPATNPIAFSFSGGGSTAADVSNKSPFMFGQPATMAPTDRPVTPPKNHDQEFRMEESPTRELQQVNGNKTSATLNGAFSFGAGNLSSNGLFGGQTPSSLSSSTPFSFGAPPASNLFAQKDNKVAEPKGFGGFGQPSNGVPTITTSFSFGQQAKSPEDSQRPSTAGPFSFGGAPTSATSPAPAFSFGPSAPTNAFGQPSSGSAPSSPSTFNQPTPFSFGAPAPSTNTPFGFGSQPNSPAGGVNLALPQPAGGFANGGGFGQPQQPSSPFSGPIALAPSTSGGAGGNLFTIGAAPAQAPAGGPRQIKKLPNRRGGVKR